MSITPVEKLVEEASRQIETLDPLSALQGQARGEFILVDIRDIRELDREGRVHEAVHAPRGMLEFWFDPDCRYHRAVFGARDRKYVLFCAMGWRSALATKTLKDMGFENIAHIDGGFQALRENGARIDKPTDPKFPDNPPQSGKHQP
jgi:rhodanese-related sulfurtransferase